MTELGPIFARLGLGQYLDSFIIEGFETWETVLDIQEGDLDALNVKLGHRRKLQREIANTRELLEDRPLSSPAAESLGDVERNSDRSSTTPTTLNDRQGTTTEAKRKYRRHPKPDKNAPERPPSAYVIFSNQVREEVRGQNLSFTEIAKLVGDRWQNSNQDEKAPFELQANAAKEKFNAELAQYKKTDQYNEYAQYIEEFKAKHSGSISQVKRARLGQGHVKGASKSNEVSVETRAEQMTAQTRDSSAGSTSSAMYQANTLSPIGTTPSLPSTMLGYGTSAQALRISSSPTGCSPPLKSDPRDLRIPPGHPINAGQSHRLQGEFSDVHSCSGPLSLATASDNATRLAADPSFARRNAGTFPSPPPLQHHCSSGSSNERSDSSGSSNALPATPADDPWHNQQAGRKPQIPEWPGRYNPQLASGCSASHLQQPPLLSSDRVLDISRNPRQRTLPVPVPCVRHNLSELSGGYILNPSLLATSDPSTARLGELREEISSPLESSENDAANALAVLACSRR